MVTLQIILILVVFAFFVFMMIRNKIPALIALPLMGIAFTLVGGLPFSEIAKVVEDGALLLRGAYVPIIVAGIFGDVIKKTGIAENIIRRSVELAGDNTLVVALVCLVVATVCFMGLYGTGALIMIGLIIIPILLSVGVPKVVAAGILLMGCFLGYAFNAGKWAFFVSLFTINDTAMVTLQDVASMAWKFMIPAAIIAIIFVVYGCLRKPKLLSWATEASDDLKKKADYEKVPLISLLAPVVPVVLVLVFNMSNVCLALFIGIAYAVITTQFKKKFKGCMKLITSAAYDGFQGVAMTVVLMFGVGILVIAAQRPELSEAMTAIISAITPKSVIAFVVIFGVVGPLLTQYRGPMSPWGLGSALAKILATTTTLSTPVLLMTFMAYDYIVGVSDATSSQVVWAAGEVDTSPVKVQIGTLPFTWATSIVAVILAVIMFPVFGG